MKSVNKRKIENLLEKLYDEILVEMPYLFNLDPTKIPNSGEHFDLEMEKYPTEESLTHYLSKLFRAGTWTDGYGNTITIRNWEESQNLFKRMVMDKNVLKYILRIVKLANLSDARRWLITLRKKIDQVSFMHESSMWPKVRKKYKIYAMYKQDGSSHLKGRGTAYSPLQAVSYFLRLHPEFNNDRLFHVYAEEDLPIARTPYKDD